MMLFPDELYKSLLNAMDSIGKYRDSLDSMNKSFQDKMVSTMISLSTLSNPIPPIINIGKIMDGVSMSLSSTSQKFSAVLLQHGWPPHHQMNLNHMIRIIEANDKEGENPEQVRKIIDETFIKFYQKERVLQLLESWESKEWLERRIPILKDAIQAHLKGMFFVSAPTVLTQIEGIIADGYHHKGRMAGRNLENYTEKLLSNGDEFSYDLAIHEYFLQVILVGFEHGAPVESFLSRHAILHGADTSYGTKVNSLKSLLLFDYFQDKFGFVSIPNDEVYHKIGCPLIERFKVDHPTETLFILNSVKQAEKLEKIPCELCVNHEESTDFRSTT